MYFQTALHALCDGYVDFVVVGGVAGTFHRSARVTFDLDICYSRVPKNLSRLTAALSPFYPRTLGNATSLTLQTDVGEIDLLAEVAGLGDYAEVKRHSILVEASDRTIATLTLPALIRAKLASGREKDLSAVLELQSLLEAAEQ